MRDIYNCLSYYYYLSVHFTWGAKEFWLPAIAVAMPLVSIPLFAFSEQSIRLNGLALQIMGFAITAAGLHGKRRAFEHPGWMQRIQRHWMSRPRPSQTIVGSIEATFAPQFGVSIRGSMGPKKDAPMEDRLRVLEDNY